MPKFSANGVELFYEVTGEGFPLVLSHEFAGNYHSWDAQVKFFSRRYQVITYAARGYPPSDVPTDPEAYSQDQSVEDLYQLLWHLDIQQAYVGGLSMGAGVVLNFGIAHPEMCRALIVAAAGSVGDDREKYLATSEAAADKMLNQGMLAVADDYAKNPARVQFLRKDPKGWEEFHRELASHSALGSALTYRGVRMKRPAIYELEDKLGRIPMPTLIMVGDEDEPCLEPAIFMKRRIPNAGLVVFPKSGHVINLEEPDLFNRTVQDFLTAVETGSWRK